MIASILILFPSLSLAHSAQIGDSRKADIPDSSQKRLVFFLTNFLDEPNQPKHARPIRVQTSLRRRIVTPEREDV